MRPIYHHKAESYASSYPRVLLALVLWRTLSAVDGVVQDLGTAPRKLLRNSVKIRSLDVLRLHETTKLSARVVSTAPPGLKILLQRLKLPLPNRPKIVEDVVPTLADLIN